MPNVKFSELPLATSVDGNDIFTLVQQPELINKIVTYQTLVNQITALTPVQQTSFVRLSGDTMTGYLTLNAAPVNNLHAATKQYVDEISADTPVGTVMYFAASSAPIGWFECDGRNLDTQSFPDLFAAIRYTYGGSGVNFRLPDLRGEFLRGWDNGRGIDSGRAFGALQADIIKNHTHPIPVDLPLAYGGTFMGTCQRGATAPGPGVNATLAQTGSGTETRPRNVALLPCIKYSSTAQVTQVGLSAQELINYITRLQTGFVRLSGDTMTGYLALNANPVNNLHAATKQYVDNFVPIAGGTMTGYLTLNANPVNNLHAATKQYVDGIYINPMSVAKAWVNFNGTTSPGTRRSFYNVSSVTRTGVGSYTINFTTPMADANYTMFASAIDGDTGSGRAFVFLLAGQTTTSLPIRVGHYNGGASDWPWVSVVVFGN